MTYNGATRFQELSVVRRVYLTMKQCLIAFLFDLGGIFAGWIMSHAIPVLSIAPWLLIIYPMILTIRGNINGILSGNLSTLLNIGLIKPRFMKNTEIFYSLISSIMAVVLIVGLLSGGIATILGSMFLNIPLTEFYLIGPISLLAMLLSTFLIVPITISIAILTFRLGLDPDILVYPIMSTIADIIASFCLFLAVDLVLISFSKELIASFLLVLILSIYPTYLSIDRFIKGDEGFIKNIKEITPFITALLIISSIAGSMLSMFKKAIEANSYLLMVFPAVICTIGDMGSIIGSITTTRLNLGFLKPKLSELRRILPEILGVEVIAILMFLLYGIIGWVLAFLNSYFIPLLLLVNLVSFPVITVLSFLTAMRTFKHGWNPCLLYTSPSPRDLSTSRMPSSA